VSVNKSWQYQATFDTAMIGAMKIHQQQFDHKAVVEAVGITPATLLNWANRGVLGLSRSQQNPGGG